jgi:hypothetical protein
MWFKRYETHPWLSENMDHIIGGMSPTIINHEDGDLLRKDHQTTKSINIWYEDGPDIVEEHASVDVRLLVTSQNHIPAETSPLLLKYS